jgi:hypothetical protein
VVAIEGTLYCHEKILVARGDLSIVTIIIEVAISGTLFYYDKCLVAKDGLSIATINTWLIYLDPLLPHNCVAIVWRLYCHDHSVFLLFSPFSKDFLKYAPDEKISENGPWA